MLLDPQVSFQLLGILIDVGPPNKFEEMGLAVPCCNFFWTSIQDRTSRVRIYADFRRRERWPWRDEIGV